MNFFETYVDYKLFIAILISPSEENIKAFKPSSSYYIFSN